MRQRRTSRMPSRICLHCGRSLPVTSFDGSACTCRQCVASGLERISRFDERNRYRGSYNDSAARRRRRS